MCEKLYILFEVKQRTIHIILLILLLGKTSTKKKQQQKGSRMRCFSIVSSRQEKPLTQGTLKNIINKLINLKLNTSNKPLHALPVLGKCDNECLYISIDRNICLYTTAPSDL